MEYIKLTDNMINTELFSDFHRHQVVTKCHRKINGEWVVIDNPFVEDWGEKEFEYLVQCLKNTVGTGGVVFGAFLNSKLAGLASAENTFFGSRGQYLELSCIQVTEELRGKGIGKKLFRLISEWAKEQGAEKLYISSHSSVESQSFYKAMGCIEAEEYSSSHVEQEPFECQLEFILNTDKAAEITLIREHPEKIDAATEWFCRKWGIPKEAYLESMKECVKNKGAVPEWYIIEEKGEIIAGMGVIENDFHGRKDLAPNVCAVYVEESHRCRGIAGYLLKFVCEDMHSKGIDVLYLVTSHNGFYERYGWEHFCNVSEDNGNTAKLYRHIYK